MQQKLVAAFVPLYLDGAMHPSNKLYKDERAQNHLASFSVSFFREKVAASGAMDTSRNMLLLLLLLLQHDGSLSVVISKQ